MKKLLPLFVVFILLSRFGAAQQQPIANELPDMVITLLDGKQVVARQLTGNIIVVVFFPDCEHCQREAKAIQQRIDAFKKYNLYFVATTPDDQIKKFSEDYGLSKIKNVKFGRIETPAVYRNFGPISTPSMYIYKEKKLTKKFNGETKIEEIIKSL